MRSDIASQATSNACFPFDQRGEAVRPARFYLSAVAHLAEYGSYDEQCARDQPPNRIEVLVAPARRRRVPAGGAWSSALHVRHDKQQQPSPSKQTEPRLAAVAT